MKSVSAPARPILGIAHWWVGGYRFEQSSPRNPFPVGTVAHNSNVIGQMGFHLEKAYTSPDQRGRVTLGSLLSHGGYRVLKNDRGQPLLDPVVQIPASEAWLWQSPELRASMERAMAQAGAGEFKDLGSFADYADDR